MDTELKLKSKIENFEKYLDDKLSNTEYDTGRGFADEAEKICREKLVDFINEEKIDNIKYEDVLPRNPEDTKALEDLRYKSIFFDVKTKKVGKKFDINKLLEEKEKNILEYYSKDQLIEICKNNNVKYNKSDTKPKLASKISNELNNTDILLELQQSANAIKESKGGGDAQLISYIKLINEVLNKRQELFYIVIIYEENNKKNKIKNIYICDIYKINFAKLNIYLGNQYYFSNKLLYKYRSEESKDVNETIKKIKHKVKKTRMNLIDKYVEEVNNLQSGDYDNLQEAIYFEDDIDKLFDIIEKKLKNLNLITKTQDNQQQVSHSFIHQQQLYAREAMDN